MTWLLLVFCKRAKQLVGVVAVNRGAYPYHVDCPHCGPRQKLTRIHSLQLAYARFWHFVVSPRDAALLQRLRVLGYAAPRDLIDTVIAR